MNTYIYSALLATVFISAGCFGSGESGTLPANTTPPQVAMIAQTFEEDQLETEEVLMGLPPGFSSECLATKRGCKINSKQFEIENESFRPVYEVPLEEGTTSFRVEFYFSSWMGYHCKPVRCQTFVEGRDRQVLEAIEFPGENDCICSDNFTFEFKSPNSTTLRLWRFYP